MSIKICVFTGSRAEYGLLFPLISALKTRSGYTLQILVSGTHLSTEFGLTYKQIEEDGFCINEKVEMLLSADSDTAIVKSTGIALMGYADALSRLNPDWLLLLGDRFEAFAAATAAHLKKIPVVHLHGGEITEGATDDALRHAISKMSYLHFTSTESHRRRVIQLGEEPFRVFNVGAIGIDNIKQLKLLSKAQLEASLNFSIGEDCILVTFHPVTLESHTATAQLHDLLGVLNKFPELKVVFTLPNADAEGRALIEMIRHFVSENQLRAVSFTSLGQLRYLSLMRLVKAVVGNSSSGIIEAPSFGVPTLNIGDRQKGRERAESVLNVSHEPKAIEEGLNKVLSQTFQDFARTVNNPYGNGDSTIKILNILDQFKQPLDLKKTFFDL
ncbi:UDP-N-acetylglucosamine 2-epimerase [Arcticibacter tournemirensis]